jgi:small-conductance mechanosensitive channel
VRRIDLRTTVLETTQGQIIYLPNKMVFESRLINYTESRRRRVDLSVGISYGEELEKVRKVVTEALDPLPIRIPSTEVEIFFTEFSDSAISFVARFWIDFNRQRDFVAARSEALMAVKEAFDREGIVIPFPIRTLDFAIKGGRSLREELSESQPMNEERGPARPDAS